MRSVRAEVSKPGRAGPLRWQPLRALTLRAADHPRGQPYLSAASGLVCAFGRAYVVADDEHHLGVFRDAHSPGRLYRVLAGGLPHDAAERKKAKPDLEALAMVPGQDGRGATLWLFGSGSTPARERALIQPLDAAGEPRGAARVLDLAPLIAPIRRRLGTLNIEAVLVEPGGSGASAAGLTLFHRGGSGERGVNAIARVAWPQVQEWLASAAGADGGPARPAVEFAPASVIEVPLGAVRGPMRCPMRGAVRGAGPAVAYGFTDAAALPASLGGGCLFTAVAEDSADHVADGACVGSAIGRLSPTGELLWLRPLAASPATAGAPKVEGLALHGDAGGVTLCLATDGDRPEVPSQLLLARLDAGDL